MESVRGDRAVPLDEYIDHLPPLIPPEEVHEVSRFLLAKCPVAHSDQDGGYWLVSRHDELVRVMQDWRSFASGNRGVRVPHMPIAQPPMPPIDSNPPLHRKVREVMNPYLAPQALAKHEDLFREVIGGLVEEFAADGHADIATQLAKKFPSHLTSLVMFGVTDPGELDKLRVWVRRLSYDMLREDPKMLAAIQEEWIAWIQDLIDRRRAEPGDDIVSALLQLELEDRGRLSDQEIIGAVQILTLGG